MDTKYPQALILIFMHHFQESISETFIYNRLGQDAILPCVASTCSIVTWLYNRNQSQYFVEVVNGNVLKRSARAARLSVNTDCSLVITNITTEDVGYYTCRQGRTTYLDKLVFLSVLTISTSPADADPKRDDEVTLECSLSRHSDVIPCQQNSIRWINETGAELLGEGVGYKVIRQTDCVSVLTVKRQSGINRRYTCQFTDKNKVEIETDYTLDFTVPTDDQTSIIIGAVVGAVAVLVVIAAVVIRYRKRAEVTENVQIQSQHPVEPESNLTYVTVNHANQKASPHIQVKEEEVTYSAVKY